MRRNLRTVLLSVLVLGNVSCAASSTSVASIVRSNAPSYSPGHILVVAAYSNLSWRADVENRLQSQHPAFRASVGVLEPAAINDPEAIVSHAVADLSIEAILLIAPAGSGLAESFIANQFYVGTVTKPWASTAATLYDLVDREIVWQADASTGGNAHASWSHVRNSFVTEIVTQLRTDGLLSDRRRFRRKITAAEQRINNQVYWDRALPGANQLIEIHPDDSNPYLGGRSVVERLAPGIVRLEGDQELGSGFVLSRNGLALTTYHTISGQTRLTARFHDGRTAMVRVLRVAEHIDTALIEIQCDSSCFTVRVGSMRDVVAGSEIHTLSNPKSSPSYISRGIVGEVRPVGKDVTLLQVDAALNEETAGGPIVDPTSERAVGLASFKLSQAERLGFAIAIDDALRSLGVRVH